MSVIEGIASWAEMLRDTMAAAGGLEQSIIASATVAPPAIRREVAALAVRLERERLPIALQEFATQVDDPTCALVVAALLLAAAKTPKRDRKSIVAGKQVSERENHGGRRITK